MTALPAAPLALDIITALRAALPVSYMVGDGEGPIDPASHVPYVVVYADAGMGEGAPLLPNRALTMTFSVRCVGATRAQSAAGGDRVRAALDSNVITSTTGRRVYVFQSGATPVLRDDSLAPTVLFEHLLMFGLRSDA